MRRSTGRATGLARRARMAMLAGLVAAAVGAVPAGADAGARRSVGVVLRDDALEMDVEVVGAAIDLSITNRGTKVHELAVDKVRAGTTVADAIDAAANGVGEPSFVLSDPGSVFFLGVGEQVRYQRTLEPGTYLYVVPRVDGAPQLDRRAYHLVRVVEDGDRRAIDRGRTISLRDDAVVLPKIVAGRGTYVIANDGSIAHEVFVVGVRDPADLARSDELGAWLEGGQVGPPPFPVHLPGSHQTVDPGVRVAITWDLHRATTYTFIDFQTGATAMAVIR